MKKTGIILVFITLVAPLTYSMQPEIVTIKDLESIEPIPDISHYKLLYNKSIHNCVGPHGTLTTFSDHDETIDTLTQENSQLKTASKEKKLLYFLFDTSERMKKIIIADDEIPRTDGVASFIDKKAHRKVSFFRITHTSNQSHVQLYDIKGNFIYTLALKESDHDQKGLTRLFFERLSDTLDFSFVQN